jgi:hypothetical protein
MTKQKKIGLVVTTAHKGVFFGYGSANIPDNKIVTLTQARMCVYWSVNVQGVVGLSVTGPDSACKITKAAPDLILTDVTSIMTCTPEATAAWEKQPWG